MSSAFTENKDFVKYYQHNLFNLVAVDTLSRVTTICH